MRALLEYLSLLALAAGFMAALGATIYCWGQASKTSEMAPTTVGQFAIAGAVLTGALAIALAIYLKPNGKGDGD